MRIAAEAAGPDRLVRLAEWLADPAAWFAGTDGLAPDQRETLAGSAMLRPVLNRWLADRIGTANVALDPAFVAALPQDDELATATALATAPEPRLHLAAQYLGAALCHDLLRMAVLRVDRDRLAALLGADAVAFGLRRAPLIARPLQDLTLARMTDPLQAGRALCVSLIARVSPALHDLFRLRQSDPALPVALTERQAKAGWAVLGAAA